MREILFRAKRIDNGEWIEGWYQPPIEGTHPDGRKESLGASLTIIGQDGFLEDVYIIPETVGQFTGLTDKNGKKIFEGDILQYSIEEDQAVFVGAVKFGEFNPDGGALLNTNVGFYVELVDIEGQRTYMRKDIGYWVKFRQVEVIGNIHDNPDLLEVTDNAQHK